MYVCICNAVTETQLEEAIVQGAVTVPLLRQQLNVGSQCGTCTECLESYLESRLAHLSLANTPAELGLAT